MRELEIDLFLNENRWVSGAEISKSGADENSRKIYLDISPDAHDLIRDHGMRKFEQKIHTRLTALGIKKQCWAVRSISEDIWWPPDRDLNDVSPQVLSMIVDFPLLRMLLDITPDLACFQGHFPGKPILAGVAQLHWAVCVSQRHFKFNDVPIEVKRLKFKSIVSPPRTVELVLRKTGENEVQFEFTSLGQIHSQGRLQF